LASVLFSVLLTLPMELVNNQTYRLAGFDNRGEYLNSLKEEYGEELVNELVTYLPPSEDFDGLLVELEDNFSIW